MKSWVRSSCSYIRVLKHTHMISTWRLLVVMIYINFQKQQGKHIYIIHTYIHTLNHPTMISYIYTHLCIDIVIWIQKRMQVAKDIHMYIYIYIYIHKYIHIHIFHLNKCTWTRVVLTSFLISLSAPRLTRYSTISLCPFSAALIIAVYQYWS